MWILESKVLDTRYYLLPEKTYSVGRKDCDILILGDPAISRKHANLITSVTMQSPSVPIPRTVLTLEDLSKFGTFTNQEKMTSGEKTQLNEGDTVTFGSEKSSFTVHHEDLVVTTSCLDQAVKKTVKTLTKQLGGCLVSEWNKYVQLVVMGQISVTIKVISALITGKHVVTPEYLVQLHKAVEKHAPKPDPKLFLPNLAESQLNPEEVSFHRNEDRRFMFRGMRFVFLTDKLYQKLHQPVELAGGTTVLIETGEDQAESDLVIPGTVVVFSDQGESQVSQLPDNSQLWVNRVLSKLKEHNKRAVPESELGYAVLYCSTSKYCNPDYVMQGELAVPGVVSSAPGPSQSNIVSQYLDRSSKVKPAEVMVGPPGETARSTVMDTDKSQSQARKRVRDTVDTSPSLPPTKQQKQQQSSPIANVVKRSTSPVPIATNNNTIATNNTLATEQTNTAIKQEPMSQSAELFTTNPSTYNPKTPRLGTAADIFDDDESEFTTAADKSHLDNIFASPVIEQVKGPKVDEFDAVSSGRRNKRSQQQTSVSDTTANSDIFGAGASTQRSRQRASAEVDEFDAVSSSRKRRRQTQTQQTQRPPVEPEMLLMDTSSTAPGTQIPATATERKPVIAEVVEGEYIQAKQAPESCRVKQETADDAASESADAADAAEPKNCCGVKTASLLRPQPRLAPLEADLYMWKGKRVQNFKKFRKAGSHASQGDEDVVRLPRIIGGRDLMPHKTLKQKTLMQKFAKELEEQNSEQDNLDRNVTEMFDAVPSRRATQKKGRR